MPGISDLLKGLLGGMRVTSSPTAVAQFVQAAVTPMPDMIEVTEIVNGPVDLTWITKDVLFGSPDPESWTLPGELADKISGGLGSGSVSGVLNQVKGTLPVLSATKIPLSVAVTWQVLDENKVALAATEFALLPGTTPGEEIAVTFLPAVVELTVNPSPPEPRKRFLRAEVTLTAGSTSEKLLLPDLPVLVPALPIPKVLALFLHAHFHATENEEPGGVFVMVPSDSPIHDMDQLKSTLSTLQETARNLKSLTTFAAFLLGLSDLVEALAATPHFGFAVTNGIANLNDITLIQNEWYANDIELEDELSSMILVAPAGETVQCFGNTDFGPADPRFDLIAGLNNIAAQPTLGSFDDWFSSVKFV